MSFTLVDSNVLLDVITSDPRWSEWSADALSRAAESSALAINPIIYAEVSVGLPTIEEVEARMPVSTFRRLNLPWEAAFLAGKCFASYRRKGGSRGSPLPDFYIGAHASVAGMPLLTRDATRYRGYFPRLALISPESH